MARWWLSGLALLLVAGSAPGAPAGRESVLAGRLGTVAVYAPDGPVASIAVLIAGDGGWSAEADDLARKLQGWGALVAGIDGAAYRQAFPTAAGRCSDLAADVLELRRTLDRRAALPSPPRPIIIGYGEGAALAYAIAAQAPDGTFGGLISLEFCPDVPAGQHFCRGAGLETAPAPTGGGKVFLPRTGLAVPWVGLQGARDRACPAARAQAFLDAIPAAKFVALPEASHGLAGQDSWLEHLRDAYLKLVTRSAGHQSLDAAVDDLPLTEVPATGVPAAGHRGEFVLLLTGDGGWAGLDRELSARLAEQGMPVVALSTLQYFWKERQPEQAARDLDRILRHYAAALRRGRVLLVGYSFGANILPLIVPHLSPASRWMLASISLLAPARHASLEVHVADWVPGSVPDGPALEPLLPGLQGTPVLCLYGQEETASLCPLFPPALGRHVALPGGHHFNDDSATLARQILDFRGL
jgi:type IV secretory pathway VirJ component